MLTVLRIIARLAVALGMVLIFGKTTPNITNKVYRFVFLFVLCVSWVFAVNYFDVRLLGYHDMSWTGASIIALLSATIGTFWLRRPQDSDMR